MVDEEAAATIQNFELNLKNGDRTLIMHMSLTLPRNTTGPVPVVVMNVFGRFDNAAQAIREVRINRFLSSFIKRGYAIGEFSVQEVAIDRKGQARTSGIYQLFPDKIDCGGLMAWTWVFTV